MQGMTLLLLFLPISTTPGCVAQSPCEGPGRDDCLASLATTQMTTNAQLALETARSVENSALRDLAIVNVLTRSGAFDGHAIRTLCHAEVHSKALRAQCDYALERPHLGVAEPGGSIPTPGASKAPLPRTSTCTTHPDSDACRFENAVGLKGSAPAVAIQALSEIGDMELRGRAACATLRATRPKDMAELQSWTPMLSLLTGAWAEEASSVLGTELVALVARSCNRDGKACDLAYRQSLLPFAVETCASTGDTHGQCFDHLCGLDVELTLLRYRDRSPPDLVNLLRRRHRLAVAADPRIGAVRGCMATWFGRKLAGSADPDWAQQRCKALGAEAQVCLESLQQVTRGSTL
jgi:hypothetical protein